jgi:hypothetical protein
LSNKRHATIPGTPFRSMDDPSMSIDLPESEYLEDMHGHPNV